MAEKILGSDSNSPSTTSSGDISLPSPDTRTFEEKVNDIIDKKLKDPTLFPAEYRAWLPRYIEGQNIQLPISQVIGASAPRIVGEFVLWGGAAAAGFTLEQEVQPNYLLANGAAVGRLKWPQLFDSYGTKYGAGDSSTTFGLPNLIGRVLVARDVSGTFLTTGAVGGAETHTHTLIHTHNLSSHTHTGTLHTHQMGNHTHTGSSHTHNMSHTHTASWGTGTSTDAGGQTGGTGNLRQMQAHTHNVSGTTSYNSPADTGAGGSASTGGPSTNTTGADGNGATGAPSTNTSGAASNETTSNGSTLMPYVVVEAWLIYAGVKVE